MSGGERPIELRDVHGPTPLGGGTRRAWDLLVLMASTDFKRAYRGTALGYVWTVARPLALFAVLLVVFEHVFRIGSRVPDYPVLLLLNIVLFGFFQDATTGAVTSIVSHESIVRKTQFPRLVIPLSVVATALINLGLNLVVVFVFLLAWGVEPTWTWLLLPLIVALLALPATAVAMIVSSLYPRFRDMAIMWGLAATVLFYGTPVLYPASVVSGTLSDLIALNPLTPVFELARRWIVDPTAPWPAGGPLIAVSAAIYLIVCVIAVRVFRREAPRIAEQL